MRRRHMKTKIILLVSTLFVSLILISGCLNSETIEPYLKNINTNSLVGSWSFEEPIWSQTRNYTRDSSTAQNNGFVNGPELAAPGALGRTCGYFSHTNDSIRILDSPSLEPMELSVEAWVKAPALEANASILAKGAQGCFHASYGITTYENGNPFFYISNATTTVTSPIPGSTIWDNTWHYLAGTYDGETIRFYVDGNQIQNGISIHLTIDYNLSDDRNLTIGNYWGSCIHPYQGYLDDISIWNRALTTPEIQDHYSLAQKTTLRQPHQVNISYSELGDMLSTLLARYQSTDVIIIKGENLAVQDNFIFTTARTVLKDFQDIKVIEDMDITDFDEITTNYKIVVLLGGIETNRYTRELYNDTKWKVTSTYYAAPIFLRLGTHPDVERYLMVFYTTLETSNLENKAVERSPLASILDKRVVPIVATVICISLLYLWSLLSNILIEFFFDYTSEHLEDHKIRRHFKNIFNPTVQYTGNLVSKREIGGMFLAILVFATALSWTWSEDLQTFLGLFIINILIITLIYVVRESIRLHFSHKQNLHTEHIFWPFGALMTIGSTILGNTFSLASYTVLENEEETKAYGHMYYRIFTILFLITWALFFINLYYPTIVLQMLYVFTIMSVVIDMTPVKPMDGADVKRWNARRWALLYILVILTYISVNFANLLYL